MFYTNTFSTTKLMDVLEGFVNGDAKVMKYKYAEADYVNPTSAANSLRAHIKKNRMANRYKVSVRNDSVYVIKTF